MDRRTFLQSAGVAAPPLADLEGTVNTVQGPADETSTGPSVFSLRESPGVRVSGGRRRWRRRDHDRQDVAVGYEVPARGSTTLVVECVGA